eukprot:2130419-Pleurochrysis_carterae.AAC.2
MPKGGWRVGRTPRSLARPLASPSCVRGVRASVWLRDPGGARPTVIMRLRLSCSVNCAASLNTLTARTVGVADSKPFHSAAIRWVSGKSQKLEKHTSAKQNARTGKQEWNAKPNESFRNKQRRELRRYRSTSQFATTLPAGFPGIYVPSMIESTLAKQANLTGKVISQLYSTCEVLGHNGRGVHQDYSHHPGNRCRALN